MNAPTPDVISRLSSIVGAKHVVTDPSAMQSHLIEPRGLFVGRAQAVVRPGNVAEVAAIMRVASETRTPIVPQGGGTGLVGGGTPDASGQALVLSLSRLKSVREIDTDSDTMTVEAGLTLAEAQALADQHERLFPLSLASEGSCTIGGTISTNAGGTAVLAYGNMRDLIVGLEVVLADGRIWHGLRKLKKDNTGYDLRHLFAGSEGTLGVVTAAVLKLFPKPERFQTAFIGVPSVSHAVSLLRRARRMASSSLIACEILPRFGLDIVLTHGSDTRDPLGSTHAWYVLLELAGPDGGVEMEDILEGALEAGEIDDAALAGSLDQRAAFWRLRHLMSELQQFEGGSIKHDVSVPVAALPHFMEEAIAAAQSVSPECRPVPFGHIGDGNIHFNVSQPKDMNKIQFLDLWEEMNTAVHAVVLRHGGSISAEHGIGRLKRDLLPGVKDPVELDMMKTIKNALDPLGILNPGCVLAATGVQR